MSLIKRIKNKIKLQAHSGNNYYCPFCGYTSKDLEIVGHDLPVLVEKDVVGGGRRAAGCYNAIPETAKDYYMLLSLKNSICHRIKI
jgi:hypothetical protein